jgi:hypothetical protein
MNNIEYDTEIKAIAACLVEDAMEHHDNDKEAALEAINDSWLHQTIDGHQWVIYYSYNHDVLRHSRNSEEYESVYDDDGLGALVREKGVNSLHMMMAYFAMYADVQQALDDAFEEI